MQYVGVLLFLSGSPRWHSFLTAIEARFIKTVYLICNMIFRQATTADIPQIQTVRNAVKENVLSDPALVSDHDNEVYLTERGKGWVCVDTGKIVGFAIADLVENNIWALFILPEYEGRGIGKTLHNMMLNWYFEQTQQTVWLGTAFATRAENFYRMQGWKEAGTHGPKEIKFEMSYADWKGRKSI